MLRYVCGVGFFLASYLEAVDIPLSTLLTPISRNEWEYFTLFKEGGVKKEKRQAQFFKSSIRHSRIQDPSLGSDWGARTGVNYDTIVENWNLVASYTRFHSKFFASTQTASGLFVPTWKQGENFSLQEGSAWRLHLDLADLEIGRQIQAARSCLVRPHVGLRGAWIYQKSKMLPRQEISLMGPTKKPPFFANNCLGVGLRGGIDSLLQITPTMSFFGDGAISVLTGYYNITERTRPIQRDSFLEEEERGRSGGIATAEFALGMHFERKIFLEKTLSFRIGYELNYVFNQTRWMDWFSNAKGALSDAGSGLPLQGITAGLRLDF